MSLPPRFRSDLWRRIAEAQDASPQNGRPLHEVGRDVSRVIAARLAGHGGARRRRLRLPLLALCLGSAVTIAAMVVLLLPQVVLHRAVVSNSLSLSGVRGADGRAFVADARSDLPLQFSDGSKVTFRAGSAGRMQRLTGSGAEIVLERGWLEAHVVHAETTLWLIHAGPYRVRVTGTRFAMTWAAQNLEVDLFEGAVVVDGSVLGAGVPLRAGHRLRISSGTILVEPLGVAASTVALGAAGAVDGVGAMPAEAPASPRLATASPSASIAGDGVVPVLSAVLSDDRAATDDVGQETGPSEEARSRSRGPGTVLSGSGVRGQNQGQNQGQEQDRWLVLADRGRYREALAAAKRLGWGALCRRLDSRRLLTLGDVARYSGAHAKAKQAFQALVTRFPADRLAADAVFSLGRLAFESRNPGEATRWFSRYVADWPGAPLADQAAGRLLECAIRLDDREAARMAARRYLVRAPHGPHATLAREVLDQPADGPP